VAIVVPRNLGMCIGIRVLTPFLSGAFYDFLFSVFFVVFCWAVVLFFFCVFFYAGLC